MDNIPTHVHDNNFSLFHVESFPDGLHIRPDRSQVYVKDGMLHREDGPAVIYYDGGISFWYQHRPYFYLDDYAKAAGIFDTDVYIMLKLQYD